MPDIHKATIILFFYVYYPYTFRLSNYSERVYNIASSRSKKRRKLHYVPWLHIYYLILELYNVLNYLAKYL